MAGNLAVRIAFAVVAIPAVLAAVWQGGLVLVGVTALAAMLGTREVLYLAAQRGTRSHGTLAVLTAAVLPWLAWIAVSDPGAAALLPARAVSGVVLWLLAALLLTLWFVPADRHPLAAASVTLLAPLYAGGTLAFLVVLRHGAGHGLRSWPAVGLVFLPLAVTWVCDSVAMLVGRRLGGPKLAPRVSPGKTWSGTIGGVVGALAAALAYQALVAEPLRLALTPWQALAVGGVVGVFGQLGDLAESLLKREAGVKDSSRLLPGHGGVLDRLDSLYFVIPLTAILYRAFGLL